MYSDSVKNMSACADQNYVSSLMDVRLEKMGNSKKFPISQKAHSLYEKIIFCHRPLLYLQTKKIPRTSQSMVIATQTPKIPIWNTMVSR